LNDIITGAATGCNGLGRFNIGANAPSFPVLAGMQLKDGIQSLDMALSISAGCSKSALLFSKILERYEGRQTCLCAIRKHNNKFKYKLRFTVGLLSMRICDTNC
jgi:hypothetical protein